MPSEQEPHKTGNSGLKPLPQGKAKDPPWRVHLPVDPKHTQGEKK